MTTLPAGLNFSATYSGGPVTAGNTAYSVWTCPAGVGTVWTTIFPMTPPAGMFDSTVFGIQPNGLSALGGGPGDPTGVTAWPVVPGAQYAVRGGVAISWQMTSPGTFSTNTVGGTWSCIASGTAVTARAWGAGGGGGGLGAGPLTVIGGGPTFFGTVIAGGGAGGVTGSMGGFGAGGAGGTGTFAGGAGIGAAGPGGGGGSGGTASAGNSAGGGGSGAGAAAVAGGGPGGNGLSAGAGPGSLPASGPGGGGGGAASWVGPGILVGNGGGGGGGGFTLGTMTTTAGGTYSFGIGQGGQVAPPANSPALNGGGLYGGDGWDGQLILSGF